MITRKPTVAVFCGFDSETHDDQLLSEKDFAYQVVCACDHGRLSPAESVAGSGNDNLNRDKSIGGVEEAICDFEVLGEWDYAGVADADFDLIDRSDLCLVVLPKRANYNPPTSVFAFAEALVALGNGKAVLAVVEDEIDSNKLPYLSDRARWLPNFKRDDVVSRAEELRRIFWNRVEAWRYEQKDLAVRKNELTDNLYGEVIHLILAADSASIHNHSALALSSQLDPFEVGRSMFTTFCETVPDWIACANRALYFEVEEALITGSWVRVDRLARHRWLADTDIVADIRGRRESQRHLELYRAVSLISEAEYDGFGKTAPERRHIALARIGSVVAHLWRLKIANEKDSKITYTLNAFPTVATQSVPTTLYTTVSDEKKHKEYKFGIWGFLRSPSSTETAKKESYVLAQNHDIVDLWTEHVDGYFDGQARANYGCYPLFVNGAMHLENLFNIVGARAAEETLDFLNGCQMTDGSNRERRCLPSAAGRWFQSALAKWCLRRASEATP